jgi:hypothetical protein
MMMNCSSAVKQVSLNLHQLSHRTCNLFEFIMKRNRVNLLKPDKYRLETAVIYSALGGTVMYDIIHLALCYRVLEDSPLTHIYCRV